MRVQLDVARKTDGIEVPPLNGSAHGAPRFTVVPTIAKPALGCQGLDIIEIALAAFRGIPEFETTQAGRVDNRATFQSCEQLAMGCRMPAATVVGSDLLCRLRRASQQPVRQCRLAYARRADKRHSPVALEILLKITSAIVERAR